MPASSRRRAGGGAATDAITCSACAIAWPQVRALTPVDMQIDWTAEANQPITPKLLGTKVFKNIPISDVVKYIDWNPFFQVWQLRGRYPNRGYPKIFDDKTV
jgi:cobalamin-dependent methionine synthase I